MGVQVGRLRERIHLGGGCHLVSNLESYSFSLIFVFQNSSSGVNSSVDSVESTLKSVYAIVCCVRKEGKEVRRKERKRGGTRSSIGEWASDCEARGHEHEDVRELHLVDSVESVGFCFCFLYRLWKMIEVGSKKLIGLVFFCGDGRLCSLLLYTNTRDIWNRSGTHPNNALR